LRPTSGRETNSRNSKGWGEKRRRTRSRESERGGGLEKKYKKLLGNRQNSFQGTGGESSKKKNVNVTWETEIG